MTMAMPRMTKAAVRAGADFLGKVTILDDAGRGMPALGVRVNGVAAVAEVIAFSRSSASSPVVEYRNWGFSWVQRATMESYAVGHPEMADGGVFVSSGRDPVSSSWRITPVEKMSARRSTCCR